MAVLPPNSPLGRLIAAPMRPGRLGWIGLRPARHAPMLTPDDATLVAADIAGDRYRTSRDGARQVTLIAAEDLAAIAAFLGRDSVAPEAVQRNVRDPRRDLVALKGQRFRVGAALLEGTGECAPCSKMEQSAGRGGSTRCGRPRQPGRRG